MNQDFSRLVDGCWYRARYPDLSPADIDPALHYFCTGARAGHDPNAYFDTKWYLTRYPDVAASGQEPLYHYLVYGAAEDRDPSPFFETRWYRAENFGVDAENVNPLLHYLSTPTDQGGNPSPAWKLLDKQWYQSRYPDVAKSNIDPIAHYISFGVERGCDPNPYFETNWYLARNPDVAAARVNPLIHYYYKGAFEGRDPSPLFHSKWYLAQNPDVAHCGMNPLVHYLHYGIDEERAPRSNRDDDMPTTFFNVGARERFGQVCTQSEGNPNTGLSVQIEDLIPATKGEFAVAPGTTVDVVVPIYRGFEETRRCINSILQSRAENRTFGRLILIDDCIPTTRLRRHVASIARHDGIVLLVNPTNMGFVASVNRGMALAGANDVVLLNSDTVVNGNWLDRLVAQAYAAPRIGTVTPFSNNATICSYPEIGGSPDLPPGIALADIDDACAAANAGRCIELPTSVGFCMLIKRSCLIEVGNFDEGTFGAGYGEETDFCQRALRRGWKHVLAANVFVYHRGETSFGESSRERKSIAAKLIRDLYPDYENEVARWVELDPAKSARLTATAALWKQSGHPVVLHILHGWGGGTEKHVAELVGGEHSRAHSLIVIVGRDPVGLAFSLLIPEGPAYRSVEFSAGEIIDTIPLFASFGIARIHVHHFIDCFDQISNFLRRLDVPYDVSIHDYAAICPRISLTDRNFHYCGEPDERGCLSCLSADGFKTSSDILWWRELGKSLIRGACTVYCPSVDVVNRIKKYVPDANTLFAPHEPQLYQPQASLVPRSLSSKQVMVVAVLGDLSGHKGGAFLLECIGAARRRQLPIAWHVIGEFQPSLAGLAKRLDDVLLITGRYDIPKLPQLISDAKPHLILFPQRSPETYNYTLSEAFAARAPILAPNFGAFAERTKDVELCWTYPPELSAEQLVETLLEIRETFEQRDTPEPGAAPTMHTTDA